MNTEVPEIPDNEGRGGLTFTGAFRRSGALVPGSFAASMLFVSLVLPNLVFSGNFWFESLHLMKWVTALAPLALLLVIAGLRLALLERVRERFVLDTFGAIWLLFALLLLFQPIWAPVTSWSTFAREWFFFVSLWGIYIVARHGLEGGVLHLFLLGAAANAAVNVIFAELQIRGSQGILSLIYPAPGNYIGNTGQQNMLGLWLAIAMLGSAWIFTLKSSADRDGFFERLLSALNLTLFSICAWGLWNTTSRSAVLSFITGLFALALLSSGRRDCKRVLKRVALLVFILALTLCGTVGLGRGGTFVMKTKDIVENFQTIGKRDSIWATAGEMFLMHPVRGVGLGHFKWNYLDAQRELFRRFPDMKWQYTYWAHNEILQWLCETGIFGGLALAGLGAWWILALFRRARGGGPLPEEALWACGLLFLIWFNAFWTRPFHRIENAVWMSLAFAVANREIFRGRKPRSWSGRHWAARGLGVAMCAGTIAGAFFLVNGMAGDRMLRLSILEKGTMARTALLEKARERLMVRDTAARQLAYHFIRAGEKENRVEYIAEGLERLHVHFLSQPHSADLFRLLGLYSELGEDELLESLTGYLKPGSYEVENGKISFDPEVYGIFAGN